MAVGDDSPAAFSFPSVAHYTRADFSLTISFGIARETRMLLRIRTRESSALLQLAVLAASAVVNALLHVEAVRFGLAGDALANTRQC